MESKILSRLSVTPWRILGLTLLTLLVTGAALAVPRPTIYGQFATTNIEGPVIFWAPIQVNYEIDRITVNVAAPCGDFSQSFDPTETPFFDVGKLTGEVDGTYRYDLVISPRIDPGVQEQLMEVRGTSKEQSTLQALWDQGLLPRGPFRQTGFFEVFRGLIEDQGVPEEGAKSLSGEPGLESRNVSVENTGDSVQNISAAQTIAQSLCVGFDCPASPTFDDTTILMMENNTRIKFDDTSTAASFPRNDWEIEANSRTNGGGSYLAFNDCGQSSQGGCADDPVFLVEAGARRNALYVENSGEVGIGTANPVLELHTVSGDTPGLRLEQDGSSGFAPQTWDLAGNETSFFLRDATNGSTLPFRVRPGASSNSLVIDTDDDVGIGLLSPNTALHVQRTSGDAFIKAESTSTTSGHTAELQAVSNQNPGFRFTRTDTGDEWASIVGGTGNFILNANGGAVEFTFASNGDFTASGVKNFATIDPGDSENMIYYAALEGPEAGTYYRGTASTQDGMAVIELPEYFSKVTELDGLTVQLTSMGGWHKLFVDEKTPTRLVIREADGADGVEFDFLIQGIRKGYSDFQVVRPKVD